MEIPESVILRISVPLCLQFCLEKIDIEYLWVFIEEFYLGWVDRIVFTEIFKCEHNLPIIPSQFSVSTAKMNSGHARVDITVFWFESIS